MSEPACKLRRTVTGGGSRCRLALKLQHKSRRSSKSPIKEPKRENRLQRRLMEACFLSYEPTRVPTVAVPLRQCLLSDTGHSNCCKRRVEARNCPQSSQKDKNRLRETTYGACFLAHERTRVPAMAGHLRTCLLNGMGRSNCCKSRVEARTRPQSTRKAPENSGNKKLCDPKSQRARLAEFHDFGSRKRR